MACYLIFRPDGRLEQVINYGPAIIKDAAHHFRNEVASGRSIFRFDSVPEMTASAVEKVCGHGWLCDGALRVDAYADIMEDKRRQKLGQHESGLVEAIVRLDALEKAKALLGSHASPQLDAGVDWWRGEREKHLQAILDPTTVVVTLPDDLLRVAGRSFPIIREA